MPRKSLFRRCLLAASLLVASIPGAAWGASTLQNLDTAHSVIHFSLSSPMMELSGKLNSYSRNIVLNESLLPTSVKIRMDVSEVNVAPIDQLGSFSPEALFKTIPNPVVTFDSKRISAIGPNKFKVEGTVTRGKKSWPADFQATLKKRSSAVSEFYFANSGPLFQLADHLPMALKTFGDQGSIECRLVFTAAGAVPTKFTK